MKIPFGCKNCDEKTFENKEYICMECWKPCKEAIKTCIGAKNDLGEKALNLVEIKD